jgi:mono/diheme cytochrome c family protein/uncharacterized membrane protein
MNVFNSILELLGRFHPLIVHFPLSLIWLAFLVESVVLFQKTEKYKPTIKIVLWIVAISSSLSVAFGLLLISQEEYGGSEVQFHKWFGITTLVLSWLTLYAFSANEVKTYRILLIISTFGVSITGHFGAILTHGDEYLTEVFEKKEVNLNPKNLEKLITTNHLDSKNNIIQPEVPTSRLTYDALNILNSRCFECHGPKKSKGKLRLDSQEFALKGGKSGPAFDLEHPGKSEMLRRILLPANHDDAMPTKGKRLTKSEISILQNWIKEGAVYTEENLNPNKRIEISSLKKVSSFHDPKEDWAQKTETFENVALVSNTLNDNQLQELNTNVRTILAHNCYSCHNATKTKGGLRLDKKEFIFKGGENGPILIAGSPAKSEIIRRIKLPDSHEDAMPSKGKRLTKNEIEILEYWIKLGAPWLNGPEKSLYRVAALEPRLPILPKITGQLSNPVDLFVNQYFIKNKIAWRKPIDDRTYIRRVYLDVIGLLPSSSELDAFVKDSSPNKRDKLVQMLLNKNEAYAQHWLSFWNDALRNDYTGTGYITKGRYSISKWLYSSLKNNVSYERFVKELISPTEESAGFIKGIAWRGTVNSSQTVAMQAAQNVAQVFLGLNLKCASCHDSFISDWKLADSYAFANVFSDTLLEIHRCDVPTGKKANYGVLYNSLGKIKETPITADRLKQLMDILVQKKNGRFYRTLVNRIWAQLLGRGIVEPVDVMDNEPWSQDLLDWLAYDFANNGTDIKRLMHQILTSKTYQLPSNSLKDPQLLVAQNFVFKGILKKRLTAEQFSDIISQAFYPIYTDSDVALKMLPSSIMTEMPFARASLVKNDAFLTSLGRPTRETVSTSRITQANLLQALELTNGSKFNNALQKGAEVWVKKYATSELLIQALYKKILNRPPTFREMNLTKKYIGEKPTVEGIQDLVWAVALSPEFQIIN